MKLALFLVLALTAHAQTPTTAEYLARMRAWDAEKARMRADAARAATLATTVTTATSSSKKDCPETKPIPSYSTSPFPQAVSTYAESGFVMDYRNGQITPPKVEFVDMRSMAPNATHEINPTVLIQTNAGWDPQMVKDTLAKTAEIYAQCGIRVGRATIVYSRFPYATTVITEQSEKDIAKATPAAAPKPWLYFVNTRADNPSQDGGGTSFAHTTGFGVLTGSAWIGHDSLVKNGVTNRFTKRPELVLGHEIAHILMDGDHQNGGDNILNGDGAHITDKIWPSECEVMKHHPYVKAL